MTERTNKLLKAKPQPVNTTLTVSGRPIQISGATLSPIKVDGTHKSTRAFVASARGLRDKGIVIVNAEDEANSDNTE